MNFISSFITHDYCLYSVLPYTLLFVFLHVIWYPHAHLFTYKHKFLTGFCIQGRLCGSFISEITRPCLILQILRPSIFPQKLWFHIFLELSSIPFYIHTKFSYSFIWEWISPSSENGWTILADYLMPVIFMEVANNSGVKLGSAVTFLWLRKLPILMRASRYKSTYS